MTARTAATNVLSAVAITNSHGLIPGLLRRARSSAGPVACIILAVPVVRRRRRGLPPGAWRLAGRKREVLEPLQAARSPPRSGPHPGNRSSRRPALCAADKPQAVRCKRSRCLLDRHLVRPSDDRLVSHPVVSSGFAPAPEPAQRVRPFITTTSGALLRRARQISRVHLTNSSNSSRRCLGDKVDGPGPPVVLRNSSKPCCIAAACCRLILASHSAAAAKRGKPARSAARFTSLHFGCHCGPASSDSAEKNAGTNFATLR